MLHTFVLLFLSFPLLAFNNNEIFEISFDKIYAQTSFLNQIEEKVLKNTLNAFDSIQLEKQNKEYYEMGVRDAKENYHYPVHFITSFLISGGIPFAVGILGGFAFENPCCAPVISAAFSIPSTFLIMMFKSKNEIEIEPFFLPDESLMENAEYMKGFKKVARKRRNNNSLFGSIGGALLGTIASGIIASYLIEDFFFFN